MARNRLTRNETWHWQESPAVGDSRVGNFVVCYYADAGDAVTGLHASTYSKRAAAISEAGRPRSNAHSANLSGVFFVM